MSWKLIFHICRNEEWLYFQNKGSYVGSSQDLKDGFIHFSTLEQIVKSAEKHRAGQNNLILLTVDPKTLGKRLKWEPSRSGAVFPHLYGTLSLKAVLRADPLRLGPDYKHIFPDGLS